MLWQRHLMFLHVPSNVPCYTSGRQTSYSVSATKRKARGLSWKANDKIGDIFPDIFCRDKCRNKTWLFRFVFLISAATIVSHNVQCRYATELVAGQWWLLPYSDFCLFIRIFFVINTIWKEKFSCFPIFQPNISRFSHIFQPNISCFSHIFRPFSPLWQIVAPLWALARGKRMISRSAQSTMVCVHAFGVRFSHGWIQVAPLWGLSQEY